MRIVINFGNGKSVEAEGKDIPEFEKAVEWARYILKE
jgi:hypothetical protein